MRSDSPKVGVLHGALPCKQGSFSKKANTVTENQVTCLLIHATNLVNLHFGY